MQLQTRKIAVCSVLVALALIFSYLEALIPIPLGVPGIKLGLANLVVIIALYALNARYALFINVVRILLASAMFANMTMAIYSLAGAFVSFGVMLLLKKTDRFSIIGVSMAGGAFHNFGQLLVASAVVEDGRMLLYLPVLLIVGMGTGIVMGVVATRVLQHRWKA